MIEDLINFINNLKVNHRLTSYNEDQAKMAIVLPILKRLGWDIERVDEVFPEFSVENRRVDYALCISGRSEVFIEAKRPAEDLESQNHQEQLLDYSYRQGVKIAVLTNGITWAFYLSMAGVEWKKRKVYTIDIIEQEISGVASKFVDLLSKENIESGRSYQNAEAIHESRLKDKAIQEALPESWNRIIEEPDSLLVELIAERTERICSFMPDLSEVITFLKSHQVEFLLLPIEEQPHQNEQPHVRPRLSPPAEEPSNSNKISQDELIPHLINILKKHGGQASKEEVEKEIHAQFSKIFAQAWYQEIVSNSVPRWQHNLAWAKERAKKRGLIKKPSESGRGVWALTEKGVRFS